jgi:hypothetical protein
VGNVKKTVMLLLGSACGVVDVFLELFVGRSDVEKR